MTRNVINVDEIEAFVEELQTRTTFPSVREWLRSTFRRWLIKFAPNAVQIVSRTNRAGETTIATVDPTTGQELPYFGSAPDWLRLALDRGETVWKVRCDPGLQRDAWVAIGWLDSLHGTPGFSRLDRISYPQALAKGRARLARISMNFQSARDQELAYQFDDGFRVVKLITARALEDEGHRMGHCAADYADDLSKRHIAILSLRDARDRPHCTIEQRGAKIVQIKGKQNRAPVAKYWPYVRQFVSGRGLSVACDAENVGLLEVAGQYLPDINAYVRAWEIMGAPAVWRITRSTTLMHQINLAPLRTIAGFEEELTDDTRARLFAMLGQRFRSGILIRIVATLDIFGFPFFVAHVDYPYGLYYLKNRNVFRDVESRQAINRYMEAALGRLLSVSRARPNWIFVTGLWDVSPMEFDEGEECDLTRAEGFDIRQIRHRRQMRLRRRLAAIRRENRKYLNDPSLSESCRLRWQTDWEKAQDLLETYAHDIL
jgi:hypothetical protein